MENPNNKNTNNNGEFVSILFLSRISRAVFNANTTKRAQRFTANQNLESRFRVIRLFVALCL